MDKPWYSKWFAGSPKSDPDSMLALARGGNAEAQYALGLKFALSTGVEQSYEQAAEWYRQAAEQSHCLAQFNLGMMYAKGQGLARDEVQSVQWFFKAALQGDAGAQHYIGNSLQRASFGASLPEATESRIEAYKWFQLAAAQGYRGSDSACANLVATMTHADLAEGNQRAAAFVVEKPKSTST